jgi:hypothetical protein
MLHAHPTSSFLIRKFDYCHLHHENAHKISHYIIFLSNFIQKIPFGSDRERFWLFVQNDAEIAPMIKDSCEISIFHPVPGVNWNVFRLSLNCVLIPTCSSNAFVPETWWQLSQFLSKFVMFTLPVILLTNHVLAFWMSCAIHPKHRVLFAWDLE